MTEKLKAWFCYAGSPGWYSCTMVLENGWAPFGHICSHPNFAPGDLFFGRPERMKIFQEMGIEVDVQPGVHKDPELPKEILEKNKEESNWKAMSDRYKELSESRPSSAEEK